ncbi:MAG: extracellular solute-binding protein [Chloroflexota bacterium]
MNRSYPRLRPAALIASIAIVVGACGGGTATTAPTTAPTSAPATATASGEPAPSVAGNACGDAPVTLNVWGGYPELDPVYTKAGAAYKAIHPNVDFVVFSTDLRGFEQKLTTALPSKTAGDVVVRTTNFLARFIDQGLIVPPPDDLKTFVKSGAFVQAVVDDATYKNEVWGVPIFNGGTALYYNTDMLAEAGLSGPPTSMDMIIEYAKKLAKLDASGNVERAGLSLRLSGQGSGVAEKFWILLLQYGKTIVAQGADGKWAADYNGPEGAKLLGMYMDFLKNKVDSPNIDHDAKAFETKAAAMFARESWVVADIATNAPDLVGHYGSVSLPVGDLGGGEYAHVPAASPNQACAWDFIKFLTDQPQQLDLVTTAGWLPARADLDLTEFLKANPGYEGFLKKPAGIKTTLAPPIPEWDEIETKLATHLVDAYADYANIAGNTTKIQSLLDEWAAETNAILKANGH